MKVRSFKKAQERQGAIAVEFAVVLPLFFILVIGTIEVGRVLEVSQVMLVAVREGARLAATDYAKSKQELQATNANVIRDVKSYIAAAGINVQELEVKITEAYNDEKELKLEDNPDPTNRRLFKVTARVPYKSVGYLKDVFFFVKENTYLTQSIVMREGHRYNQ